ncbi:hypothetical protein [Flavobacterium sp. H122]|uniref:hypothetical protein n=1 Tax=Flavobacterium sp. H122 TaxID=2529860 RepID=UPI0010AADFE6|nr:hypothetical protein [Flavobacterium sp. H122]
MQKNLKITFFTLVLFGFQQISAQGCSDAGFCSVGNTFKTTNTQLKNQIEVGGVYGLGEEDVTVFSPYVIYTRSFSEKFALNGKFTGNVANGSFGTRSNVGDIFVTGNYKFNPNASNLKWSGILGIKIPLTAGNDKINTISLPMPYQSSLGTFDIIGGLEASVKKWNFNVVAQIPLNDNKNSYLTALSPTDAFDSTNLFHRQPDVLFRSTYTVLLASEKLTLKPNVLFIYHLGNDSYVNQFGNSVTIDNSEGLTINGNLIANYKIGENSSIETSLAAPFVVREVRPDGLTRSFTVGLSFKQSL